MPSPVYGELLYLPANPHKYRPRGQWAIKAQPHVVMRLKRLFPRVEQERSGVLMLADTVEIARDLEMILPRWPLKMSPDVEDRLNKGAEQHRAMEETVLRILDGARTDMGWRDPALPARGYQLQVADLVHATGRVLCTDELGTGKTLSGMLVLRNPEALPALVVTLAGVMPKQWLRELNKFFPWLNGHIITSRTVYDPTTKRASKGIEPDVFITSYSKLDGGWADHLRGKVRTVLFDEMQELRHGEDTKKGQAAALVAHGALFRAGLTGTPIYNYGGEAWNILNILDPDVLGTKGEFLREWCADASEYGDQRKVQIADPRAFGTYLRDIGLMLHRTREDVGRELPKNAVIEQTVPTDHKTLEALTGDVADVAELMLGGDRQERFLAAGELDLRMRHATGVAKAPYVADFVKLLLEGEKNLVLFGWHRDVYGIWLERLKELRPVLYTGSESPSQKQASLDAFKSGRSRVLIMSLRSGAGLDGLQAATNVGVFGELDWSPAAHKQCVGRYHRDGQTQPTLTYYLTSDAGSDPIMIETLGVKRAQAEPMLNPDVKLFDVASDPAHAYRLKRLAEDVLRRRGRPVPVRPVVTTA
jgi:superfamily II DNA or RNA helicase